MSFGFSQLTENSRVFIILLATALLIGCGGGDGSSNDAVGAAPASLSGSVGDGPIVGATVNLYSASGAKLASTTSDQNASYSFNLVVTPQDYPLKLEVVDGTDLVTGQAPDFRMTSVAMSNADSRVNINPFSTLIVGIAESMPGGLNTTSITLAKNIVMNEMSFGLDTAVIADPITAPITAANIAQIVKASEAMGEMIRRTRDSISATGNPVSGDEIVAALAADMVDGIVDGLGGAGVDATVAAVSSIVSGQVLVETLSNSLKVGGVVATGAMDGSITTTMPETAAGQLTDSVQVTAAALDQLQTALTATQAIDSSAAVTAIETSLGNLSANMTAAQVGAIMAPGSSADLGAAITQVSQGASIDVAAVTAVLQGNSNSSPPNTNTASTGSTTLNWSAPLDRADGSSLAPNEIGGYRIYYGTAAGNYTSQIDVTDSTSASMTVSNIPVGTYYFVMTAYDGSGRESAYSGEISRTVN